jgi:hypothetical protein
MSRAVVVIDVLDTEKALFPYARHIPRGAEDSEAFLKYGGPVWTSIPLEQCWESPRGWALAGTYRHTLHLFSLARLKAGVSTKDDA